MVTSVSSVCWLCRIKKSQSVVSSPVAVNPKKAFSFADDFWTELPHLVVRQKPVQSRRTNLYDRGGAAQSVKYLIDLVIAPAGQLTDRDVALVPALSLI